METFFRCIIGIVLIQNIFGLLMSTLTVANLDASNGSKAKASTSSYSTVPIARNCLTENKDITIEISSHIKGDTSLLFFHLTFYGWSGNILDFTQGNLYKPTEWVLALGHSGKRFLFLKYNYEILSLFTLRFNTQKMDMYLNESSPNCSEKINATTFENIVRVLLFTNFKEKKAGDAICNKDIKDVNGYATFVYKCCDRNLEGTIECEELSDGKFIYVLVWIMHVITLYLMLNFPSFVPEILYRYGRYTSYKYPMECKQLNVLKTKTPKRYQNTVLTTNISRFESMASFKRKINEMEHNVLYKLKLKNIDIKVNEKCLIPEGEAPVGLLSSLKDLFVLCKIRTLPSVSKCCYADICPPCDSKCKTLSIRWYDLLSRLIIVITFIILLSPFALIFVLYDQYEKEEMNTQRDASLRVGLKFIEPVYELSVTHNIATLVFLGIQGLLIIAGICFRKNMRQLWFRYVQDGFKTVRERNISDCLGFCTYCLLKPCEICGCVGVLLAVLYYIVVIPILCFILLLYLSSVCYFEISLLFHLLRLLTICISSCICKETDENLQNLTIKQKLIHLCCKCKRLFQWKKTDENLNNKVLEVLCAVWLIISVYFICFIIFRTIPYYVEMAVYTTIGVIHNVNTVYYHISLAFVLAIYAKGRLNYIDTGTKTNVQVNQEKKVAVTIKSNGNDVHVDREEVNPPPTFVTEHGKLRWRTYALFLISENNLVCISKKFFFEACEMQHYCCPGKLLPNFIRAFYELLAIVVYLLLVVVVVLAFEETYNLSSTSTFFVTLAGSFLPLIFRTFIQTHVPVTTDKSNINLNTSFNHYLDKYREDWPIDDIVVEMSNDTEKYEGINGSETDIDVPMMQRLSLNSLTRNTDAISPVEQTRIDLLINDDTEPYDGIYESEIDINVPLLQC